MNRMVRVAAVVAYGQALFTLVFVLSGDFSPLEMVSVVLLGALGYGTWRRRRWGALGLAVLAVVDAGLKMASGIRPWIIPLAIYLLGALALERQSRKSIPATPGAEIKPGA